MAGGQLPTNTGYRPPDALNLWPAILDGGAGPRTEVVHQVENQWSCDVTQSGGGCCSSMRIGEMKLIIGGPGDSRTVEVPEQCDPTPAPGSQGYKAPCPTKEFVTGCVFDCGKESNNCEAFFGNVTRRPLITANAVACQQACAADRSCAAFQWIGVGDDTAPTLHHQCLFKCPGSILPGRTQCSIGHKFGNPGGSYVCGPKANNSHAPAPPGPPPPPAGPPPPECPVPFGQSGGSVEPGTDHARAKSTGVPRHDLVCRPWCLFNLTSDIGERNDLGQNPAYQEIAQKIAGRLKYHASTGPMPAWIWPITTWKQKVNDMCLASTASGFLEPLDAMGGLKKLP